MTAKRFKPSGVGRPKDKETAPGVNEAMRRNSTTGIRKTTGANRLPVGPNSGLTKFLSPGSKAGKLDPGYAAVMRQVTKASGRKTK
jgi:hypothetical protein